MDDDFVLLVAPQFPDALGQLLQGNQLCRVNAGDGLFAGEPAIDKQIAAIALVNDLTLVTRNRSDYDRARVAVVNLWD